MSAHESNFELLDELSTLRPNVVVLLGKTALEAFGREGISNWRGCRFLFQLRNSKCWCMPTFHPAFIMRQKRMWPTAIHDLKRAWELQFSEPRESVKVYQTHPSPQDLKQFVARVTPNQLVVLDVEGYADNLRLVGLSTGPHSGIAVPPEDAYVPALLELFRKCPQGFGGQNFSYDMGVIAESLGANVKCSFDTMLAHHLICSVLPHDLGFLNSVYADLPYYWDKDDISTNEELYNCRDLDATFQTIVGEQQDMKRDGLLPLFEHVMRAQQDVYDMTRRGLTFHKPTCDAIERTYATRVMQLAQMMKAEVKHNQWFNPDSPKDVAQYLYKELALPEAHNRKFKDGQMTKSVTTDDEALARYQGKIPWVDWLLEYRHKAKMVRTYIPDEDKTEQLDDLYFIVHPYWKMHNTETGRYSCGIHTYPPEMRQVIVARPGYTLVYVDGSQIEFHIAAYDAQDPVALEILDRGGDVHRGCAALAFHKRPEDVTPTERFMAKFVVHGGNYGRGAQSVATQFNISLTEGQQLLDDVLGPYVRMREWREGEATLATQRGYSVNSFGRRRYYLESSDSERRREAFNFRPQSEAHDLLMRAHTRIASDTRLRGCYVVADMHDALLIEIPLGSEHDLVPMITSVMEAETLPGLRIPFGSKVGNCWGDLEDRK